MSQILDETDTSTYKLNVRKIVVAVDLSPHSRKTAAYAAAFAKRFGASLTFVHAFEPERITEFTTQEVHEGYEEDKRDTEKELNKLADSVRKTYPDCYAEFRVGDPAREVSLVAEDLQADLIITASHHPGFLGRLFGIDQAPRILHRARCPVLVYHEEEEAA
ncbi:MAG: universal stress protein [Verrucomicrobia bacterium]|nr:universal stress protein [Verrucomicrobiota bacterium]MBV8273670.1 universal stress protein [Verrucomicrobiota bacterium]